MASLSELRDAMESTPDSDPTFSIVIDRKLAWIMQQVIRPGMPFEKNDHTQDMPVLRWQKYALALRWKVNGAILRFEDEEDTKEIEMDLTEAEGWILDQNVPFDGDAGMGALLLIQIFRGMWNLRMEEMGSTLPAKLVPHGGPVPEVPNPQESEEVKPETQVTWEDFFKNMGQPPPDEV